jgi:hypothetical protein
MRTVGIILRSRPVGRDAREKGTGAHARIGYAAMTTLLDSLGTLSTASALLVVEQAVRLGQRELAMEICHALLARGVTDEAVILTKAGILVRAGQKLEALKLIRTLRTRAPEHLVAKTYEGLLAAELGEEPYGLQLLVEVATQCPDYPGIAGNISALRLPGPAYREVLAALHKRVCPRGYLEIGVETGASFGLSPASQLVGVDPDMSHVDRSRLPAHARLFETTSDEFFATHVREDVYADAPLDLTFIDGLHQFEQALRDFIHVEAWSHPTSAIVLHDCIPILPAYAERERCTRFWVGDVWKVVAVLSSARPDLRIVLVPTPPSGLAVVTRLAPSSSCLKEQYQELVTAFVDLELPFVSPSGEGWPPNALLTTNDERGWAFALSSSEPSAPGPQ